MKMSNFQIIALGLCVVFLIVGVGIFASFGGLLGGTSVGPVTMWGTMDADIVSNMLATLRSQDSAFERVTYVEKDEATYSQELLNAMASGTGPDLFLIDVDHVSSFADKILPIPYSVVSDAEFNGSYVDEGAIFETSQGSLALPFMIDPLVMYWNRDLFASAGIASAPQYWSDFFTVAPKITSLSTNSNVRRSAIALGQWKNISHAKEILSALFMQAGDPITARNSEGRLTSAFGQTPPGAPSNPAEAALIFYTDFTDPGKTSYSWNASLPLSRNAFLAGDLAAYVGFASEYNSIHDTNPNLRYNVAPLPQLKGNTVRLTYGNLTGVAVSRSAPNPNGAVLVAKHLTGQQAIALLAQAVPLPPVRRDVVVNTSASAAMQVFVQSSLIATGWLDPDSVATDAIFKRMVESTISGASETSGAVADAASALNALIH